ncbi:amino acid ABC transporter permease [Brucella sp. LJL56]
MKRIDYDSLISLERVRSKHLLRYISALIILAMCVILFQSFAHAKIDWSVVREYLTAKTILSGLLKTIIMAPLAMAVGLVLGLLLALMRMSDNPVTRWVAVVYMWIFRGSPQLLQLFLWFNLALIWPVIAVPYLFEVSTVTLMTPFVATLLGLGICQSAYTAEVIRAGIMSVDMGQAEAADALGMGRGLAMRRIILPQALRAIVPPVGNEFISMVKATSLASAIQYSEILNAAQRIYYVNNYIMELLIVATFWYLLLVSLLTIGQHYVEYYLGKSSRKNNNSVLVIEDSKA